MDDCIFCKIVGGEIPSHKVYEDDSTLVFMDIHPIQPGHLLVIAKDHVETFEQLGEDSFANLMRTVHKISKKMKEVLKPSRVGLIVEGFDVAHVHVKVIPIENEVELRHIPDMQAEPDHEALAEMAQKLSL